MARNRNEDSTVDVDTPDFEEETFNNDASDGSVIESTEKANDQNTKSNKKHDLPEGFVTPVGLTNHINASTEPAGDLKPQVMYGYLKNNKEMGALVQKHTDGRNILNLEEGLRVYEGIQAKSAERRAAKEAKATEAPAEETVTA
jgi:hypothetical protein